MIARDIIIVFVLVILAVALPGLAETPGKTSAGSGGDTPAFDHARTALVVTDPQNDFLAGLPNRPPGLARPATAGITAASQTGSGLTSNGAPTAGAKSVTPAAAYGTESPACASCSAGCWG